MQFVSRSRYLFGFGFAAIILAMVGVSIMFSTLRFRTDSEWVTHTHDALRRIDQINSTLLDGVASQRSYLLTSNIDYKAEFLLARPRIRIELATLASHVADNPVQTGRVQQLGSLIEQRLDSAGEGIRIFETDGFDAARAYTQHNRGLTLMQEIEALLKETSDSEETFLATRNARSEQSATLLLTLGAGGIPLSLAILLWIYVLLTREVRERARAENRTLSLNDELADSVSGLQRAGEDLRELSHYAGLLQTCRNMPEALDVTRRTLSSLLPGCGGSVYLLNASQDYAEIETSWGMQAAPAHELMSPQECWGMRRTQPHLVDDVVEGLACSHLDPPDAGIASSACLPLSAQGVLLGVLTLTAPSRGPIDRIALAIPAAEQLSLALGNLRLQETLRQQSIRDALSGLYNRRYLVESLPREIARSQRRGQSVAVLMFDLDHFKAFNDTHGHEGGDAVIAAFGRLLQTMSRGEDIPCRYGGEEFTLILPEADLSVAQRRAEEIRIAVESMTVRHLQRDIGGITVSIGIAVMPLHGTEVDDLQRMADAALYRAKREGRNRVVVASKVHAERA